MIQQSRDQSEIIKLLLVDHNAIFREGLAKLLSDSGDIDCIAATANGEQALHLCRKLVPHVVLIDVNLPSGDPIVIISGIKQVLPETRVIVLSHEQCSRVVVSCIQARVDGYLLKDIETGKLLNIIRMVANGETVFDSRAVSRILPRIGLDRRELVHSGLKEREIEVLKLAAMGKSNKEIAHELNLTERTVATHMFNVFRKLEAESRTEAVLCALREGWFTFEDIGPIKDHTAST